MPTLLPRGKQRRRRERARFALKAAMVVTVLLLAALVQVMEQIHFAAPAQRYAAVTPSVAR
jgi:hypothetical protein